MDVTVSLVFGFVYLGMILGRIPGLALDRTGVALLGAIVLLALGRLDTEALLRAEDLPTLSLLFGLMVVSAQFRLGGFYAWLVRRLAAAQASPPALLALLIAAGGLLSAVLVNDVVCLAMTPVLVEACAQRGLDSKPFLLALACSSNLGSAATLIGNPQNMLIGQTLHLSFAGYLMDGLPTAILGLGLVWLVVAWLYRGRWQQATQLLPQETPAFNSWQTGKGVVVISLLIALFLLAPWPREVLALAAAGLLLTSRRMRTQHMLDLVDWQLLVLFVGLFAVNHALQATGEPQRVLAWLSGAGIDLSQPGWLFPVTVLLSNLVSNVPAVMLLLPSATHPQAGPLLALASTLAGNLFLVGSIANIIVAEQGARLGIRLSWREHARVGVPVTLLSLALAAVWLWLRAA